MRTLLMAMLLMLATMGCGGTGRPLVLDAYIIREQPDMERDDYVTIGCTDPTADEHHIDGAYVSIVDGKLGCAMRKEMGPEDYTKMGNEYQPYELRGFVGTSTSITSLLSFETVGDWMAAEAEELCTPDCGKDDAIDFDPKKTQSMKEFLSTLRVEAAS